MLNMFARTAPKNIIRGLSFWPKVCGEALRALIVGSVSAPYGFLTLIPALLLKQWPKSRYADKATDAFGKVAEDYKMMLEYPIQRTMRYGWVAMPFRAISLIISSIQIFAIAAIASSLLLAVGIVAFIPIMIAKAIHSKKSRAAAKTVFENNDHAGSDHPSQGSGIGGQSLRSEHHREASSKVTNPRPFEDSSLNTGTQVSSPLPF